MNKSVFPTEMGSKTPWPTKAESLKQMGFSRPRGLRFLMHVTANQYQTVVSDHKRWRRPWEVKVVSVKGARK